MKTVDYKAKEENKRMYLQRASSGRKSTRESGSKALFEGDTDPGNRDRDSPSEGRGSGE